MEYISREEHNEFVKRMEDEHKRMNHRLCDAEKVIDQMQQMNSNISELATNMKHILEEQVKQAKRLDKIEDEPKTVWSSLRKGMFSAIGAAVGAAVVAAFLFFA